MYIVKHYSVFQGVQEDYHQPLPRPTSRVRSSFHDISPGRGAGLGEGKYCDHIRSTLQALSDFKV